MFTLIYDVSHLINIHIYQEDIPLLPLTLRLAEDDQMPLRDAIARITSGPASILNIPYGDLSVGRAADLCIFDPLGNWTLNESNMHSQGKNTPFRGWEMPAQVMSELCW